MMKKNCTTLYPNEAVAQKVSDYADRHSVSLPAEFTLHYEWGARNPAKILLHYLAAGSPFLDVAGANNRG